MKTAQSHLAVSASRTQDSWRKRKKSDSGKGSEDGDERTRESQTLICDNDHGARVEYLTCDGSAGLAPRKRFEIMEYEPATVLNIVPGAVA
jgi:hypothetical protein